MDELRQSCLNLRISCANIFLKVFLNLYEQELLKLKVSEGSAGCGGSGCSSCGGCCGGDEGGVGSGRVGGGVIMVGAVVTAFGEISSNLYRASMCDI